MRTRIDDILQQQEQEQKPPRRRITIEIDFPRLPLPPLSSMRSATHNSKTIPPTQSTTSTSESTPSDTNKSHATLDDESEDAIVYTSVAGQLWRGLRAKFAQLRRMRSSDVPQLAKATRKTVGLSRSPRGKGYDRLLSETEQRYRFAVVGKEFWLRRSL